MRLLKKVRLFLLLAGIASLLLATSTLLTADFPAPSFAEAKANYRPSESWLLDRNGEVIAVRRIDDKTRRLEWVGLNEVSPAMQEVLLLSEDKRFYRHGGVDWLALASSSASYLRHFINGKRPRGASTLTMQLAGFLDPSLAPANSKRTLAQKWRQIVAAREIENSWSKAQILEAYFNLVSFRGELIGINAASAAPVRQTSFRPQSQRGAAAGGAAARAQCQRRQGEPACLRAGRSIASDVDCTALHGLAIASFETSYQVPQENLAPHLARALAGQAGRERAHHAGPRPAAHGAGSGAGAICGN